MARSILAQLVVALRDDASRNAKALAGNLKNLGDNANAFASKLNGTKWGTAFERDARRVRASAQEMAAALSGGIGWGDRFSKDLLKLRIAPKEFARVRDSWNELQRALANPTGGRTAFNVLGTQGQWRKQQLAEIIAVRNEMARFREDAQRPLSIARKGIRMGAAAVGAYGGIHVGGRAIRGTATAAGIAQREEARDYLGGLTAEQTARLQASSRSVSGRFRSIDASTMHNLLRESALSMGDVGKAISIAEPLARSLVTLQSLKGKDSALGQLTGFIRALDTLGKNQDPRQIAALIDGATKAAGVQGAEYNPADLWTTAKTAKSAGFSLNETFLSEILPSLIADMGASRPGTALGSGVAQLIGGRSTKAARSYQTKLGLRDKSGKFLTRDLFAANPYEWANTVLEPALKRSGIDTTNDTAVVEAINKAFSNQTVADVYGRMITQRDQIEKNRKALNSAPGVKAADELPKRDPFVAAEGVTSQLKNVAAALVDPIVPSAIEALNGFSGILARITSTLRENPEIGKQASTVAGSAAAGAGIVGSARAAMALWGGGGVSGAIGGGLRGALRGGILGGAAGSAWLAIQAALAGKATADVVGQSASGKNYTPRDAESVFSLAEQLNAIQSQISGVKKRTHQSRADEPNPDLDRLEGEAQDVRNRISAGTSSMGDGLVKSLADGIVAGYQTAVQAMETLMESLRARARSGVQIPVTVSPDSKPAEPSVPARGSGGSVAAGGLYRINEFGEEYFQPTEDGRIIDPRRLKAGKGVASGVGPISIGGSTFHITGVSDPSAVGEAVLQMLEQKMQAIAQAAFADIGVELA